MADRLLFPGDFGLRTMGRISDIVKWTPDAA